MAKHPEIEVGGAVASGADSFEVARRAADRAIETIEIHDLSVVFVYASVAYDLKEVLRGVGSIVGDVPIIGATTSGEILGDVHHGSVVVSAWASPHIAMHCAIGRRVSSGWRQALEDAISAPSIARFFGSSCDPWQGLTREGKSVFAVLFAPGDTKDHVSKGPEILEALKAASQSRFPVIAAAAADDLKMTDNSVLFGAEAISDGLLVAIFEIRLQFGIALTHGFVPCGDIGAVTAASGQEVLTVDGQPAGEAMPRLLGCARAVRDDEHVSLVARRVVGTSSGRGQYNLLVSNFLTERGGCRMSRAVTPGTVLTAMEPDAQSMRVAANHALRKAILRGGITSPAVAMMNYCVLRPSFMGQDASLQEIENAKAVMGGAPLFGLCSYGEGGVSEDGVSRFSHGAVSALVIGSDLSPIARVALEAERFRAEVQGKADELEALIVERTIALRKSEERFQLAMRGANDGLWDCDLANGTIYFSPRWIAMLGFEEHEIVPTFEGWSSLVHPDDLEPALARVRLCFESKAKFEVEYRMRHKNGDYIDVLSRAFLVYDDNGRPVRLVGTQMDISERKKIERSLRQSAAVFRSTHEGVVVTDADANILSVNPAFCAITGYSEQEVLARGIGVLKSGRHDTEFYKEMWRSIRETGLWRGEIWNRRKCGEIFPEWLTISAVRDDAGEVVNYVGIFNDITHIKNSELRLEHIAHHDPLTDLPNRMLLSTFLEQAISMAKRTKAVGAVLFIDLDRFKNVNDSLGHPAGDEILVLTAARLKQRLRGSDMLSRLGGDEFVVILENLTQADDAGRIAAHLIADLSDEPFELTDRREVFLGASIGVSLFPANGETADELIQHADAALYAAKDQGRGTFQYYSRDLTRAAETRLDMEARLRRALERQEFLLHYQPQVDLASGRITGVEALVRWRGPENRLVGPDDFIPLCEETGLIVPLGQWVLHTACVQMKAWQAMGVAPLSMAVNLSPRQLQIPTIVEVVRDALARTELAASCLEIEITEGALLQSGPEAARKMEDLKALGIRLAIDDFGTGYSSLAYLKHLPFDRLKIDKSFVQDMGGRPRNAAIVGAIIDLAKRLDFDIVAEGVETVEQVETLRRQGCRIAQGYYFAQPMPAEHLRELLRLRSHSRPAEAGSQGELVALFG